MALPVPAITNEMALPAQPAPPLAGNPMALVDPETRQLVQLDDPSRLPGLMELGYRPATPAELQQHELSERYDTFGQTAAAFGEGALDTLVPVVGPALEHALGVSTEDQLLRAQFHPYARGAGQLAGAVGGAMAGVGAPGLIARAGAGTAAGLGGGLLAGAAGSALEGALYSASDVANQAVLGNPGLTAETALRQIGLTTAISGGLGLLGGLAKSYARDHADQWSTDLRDFAADRTLKALGGIQSDRNLLVKKYGEAGYLQMMREISEHPAKPVGPFSTPKTSYDVGEAMLDDAWKSMQAELTKAGQAGAAVDGTALLARMQSVVSDLDGNPFVPPSSISRLTGILQKYEAGFSGRPLPLDAVHNLRKQLSQAIGYSRGAVDFDSNLAKGAMHDWRGQLSDSIEDALNQSGVGSQAWVAANRQYQLGSVVQQLAQRGINRVEGNNFVSPMEMITGIASGLLGSSGEEVPTLFGHALGRGLIGTAATALIRRQGSHVLSWVGTRAAKSLEALTNGIDDEVSAAVDKAFSGAGGIAAMKTADLFTRENYPERAAEINTFLSDPNNAALLSDPVLEAYASPVMDELRSRVAAAASAMGSQFPKYDTTGPLDPIYQPSASELSRLNRTSEIARDPMAVLMHLGRGTLTPDQVQTMDAVWPSYASVIRAKALDRLATGMTKGETVPPRLKMGLGLLFNQDLARSTSGAAIAAAQQAFAAHSPQQNAPPPPGSRAESRVRNIETHFGNRAATSTDAAIRHLQE